MPPKTARLGALHGIQSLFLAPTEEYILDKGLAERIAATVKNFRVATYEEKQSKEGPQPPFVTATLQKAGEKALGLGVNDVMALAQKLFEGGHITYMRTDSPALSNEALTGIAEACHRHGFPTVPKVRAWKAKDGAQEAHEAIRPTHFENLAPATRKPKRRCINLSGAVRLQRKLPMPFMPGKNCFGWRR